MPPGVGNSLTYKGAHSLICMFWNFFLLSSSLCTCQALCQSIPGSTVQAGCDLLQVSPPGNHRPFLNLEDVGQQSQAPAPALSLLGNHLLTRGSPLNSGHRLHILTAPCPIQGSKLPPQNPIINSHSPCESHTESLKF